MNKKLKKKSTLFTGREDWWNNACLNYSPESWEYYATGYGRAAEILLENTKRSTAELDFLVYPILFLYRHYVELRLKLLILKLSELVHERANILFNHDIKKQWELVCRLYKKAFSKYDKPIFDEIKIIIIELTKFDPNGETFRYPKNKKTTILLPDKINLSQIEDQTRKLAIFLEGLTYMVYELIHQRIKITE